jgi:hypothetical protein
MIIHRVLHQRIAMNRIFACLIVSAIVALSGQLSAQVFMPPPPIGLPQVDPCMQLRQNLNVAQMGLQQWRMVLAERQTALTRADARLAELHEIKRIWWQIIETQKTQASGGQEMFIGWINAAIIQSQLHIQDTLKKIIEAQQQVIAWAKMVKNAQDALKAAGC